MSKSYKLRQKILLSQGKITQALHDARVEQSELMKCLKKERPASIEGEVRPSEGVASDDFAGLQAREKQVVAVLVQRRALGLLAPTCDEIAKLSRLSLKLVRATVDDLLTKGVVQSTVHGRTHQARYKLVEFGGVSR
jgi:hypothetical protein